MQGGTGLIPGQGAKISYALQPISQNIKKKKKKQYCNKFNKDFKNGPYQKNFFNMLKFQNVFPGTSGEILTKFFSFRKTEECGAQSGCH